MLWLATVGENMERTALSSLFKVVQMSEYASNVPNDGQNPLADSFSESLSSDDDLLMEKILDNINDTPIGQVLKKIALLPEVRKEKVLEVRQRLCKGTYDLNDHLDVALDKVLEELTTQ